MRRFRRICDVCGDSSTYDNRPAVAQGLKAHTAEICTKQKEALEKYRSLSWDEKAWVVLLTVRGDVFDALLRDINSDKIRRHDADTP